MNTKRISGCLLIAVIGCALAYFGFGLIDSVIWDSTNYPSFSSKFTSTPSLFGLSMLLVGVLAFIFGLLEAVEAMSETG